jgi:hypothetical protein
MQPSGASAENERVDALSAAGAGMNTASSWLNSAAARIAASDGAPDVDDAVAAYVEAPAAYAANARIVGAAVATTDALFDAFA